jgi:hypothetical protein
VLNVSSLHTPTGDKSSEWGIVTNGPSATATCPTNFITPSCYTSEFRVQKALRSAPLRSAPLRSLLNYQPLLVMPRGYRSKVLRSRYVPPKNPLLSSQPIRSYVILLSLLFRSMTGKISLLYSKAMPRGYRSIGAALPLRDLLISLHFNSKSTSRGYRSEGTPLPLRDRYNSTQINHPSSRERSKVATPCYATAEFNRLLSSQPLRSYVILLSLHYVHASRLF